MEKIRSIVIALVCALMFEGVKGQGSDDKSESEQIEAHKTSFLLYDTNKDGWIDPDELR